MSTEEPLRHLRREYDSAPLRRSGLAPDPVVQFGRWFDDAVRAGVSEPNAMVLATVGPEGAPEARCVLLKHFDRDGFIFFTNYRSPKARALDLNPRAALLFYWEPLNRQVRIEGMVLRLPRDSSVRYFGERPRRSRLAALVSRQSEPCPSREDLERRFQEAEAGLAGQAPKCPEDWGGLIVRPTAFEFWQGRRDRLHDRFRYSPVQGGWSIVRLDP